MKIEKDLLDEHIDFITKRHGRLIGNIGWVSDEDAYMSKLPQEFVESWIDEDGEIHHDVTPR